MFIYTDVLQKYCLIVKKPCLFEYSLLYNLLKPIEYLTNYRPRNIPTHYFK